MMIKGLGNFDWVIEKWSLKTSDYQWLEEAVRAMVDVFKVGMSTVIMVDLTYQSDSSSDPNIRNILMDVAEVVKENLERALMKSINPSQQAPEILGKHGVKTMKTTKGWTMTAEEIANEIIGDYSPIMIERIMKQLDRNEPVQQIISGLVSNPNSEEVSNITALVQKVSEFQTADLYLTNKSRRSASKVWTPFDEYELQMIHNYDREHPELSQEEKAKALLKIMDVESQPEGYNAILKELQGDSELGKSVKSIADTADIPLVAKMGWDEAAVQRMIDMVLTGKEITEIMIEYGIKAEDEADFKNLVDRIGEGAVKSTKTMWTAQKASSLDILETLARSFSSFVSFESFGTGAIITFSNPKDMNAFLNQKERQWEEAGAWAPNGQHTIRLEANWATSARSIKTMWTAQDASGANIVTVSADNEEDAKKEVALQLQMNDSRTWFYEKWMQDGQRVVSYDQAHGVPEKKFKKDALVQIKAVDTWTDTGNGEEFESPDGKYWVTLLMGNWRLIETVTGTTLKVGNGDTPMERDSLIAYAEAMPKSMSKPTKGQLRSFYVEKELTDKITYYVSISDYVTGPYVGQVLCEIKKSGLGDYGITQRKLTEFSDTFDDVDQAEQWARNKIEDDWRANRFKSSPRRTPVNKTSTKSTLVSIKSKNDKTAIVAGYGIIWGGKDLTEEFFTQETNLEPDYVPVKHVLYDHGQVKELLDPIGRVIKMVKDDVGLWIEAEIERSNAYIEQVLKLIDDSRLGWSSGSVAQMVQKGANGFIKNWPLVEFSLTPTPAEPRTLSVERIKQMGISLGARKSRLTPTAMRLIGNDSNMRGAYNYFWDAIQMGNSGIDLVPSWLEHHNLTRLEIPAEDEQTLYDLQDEARAYWNQPQELRSVRRPASKYASPVVYLAIGTPVKVAKGDSGWWWYVGDAWPQNWTDGPFGSASEAQDNAKLNYSGITSWTEANWADQPESKSIKKPIKQDPTTSNPTIESDILSILNGTYNVTSPGLLPAGLIEEFLNTCVASLVQYTKEQISGAWEGMVALEGQKSRGRKTWTEKEWHIWTNPVYPDWTLKLDQNDMSWRLMDELNGSVYILNPRTPNIVDAITEANLMLGRMPFRSMARKTIDYWSPEGERLNSAITEYISGQGSNWHYMYRDEEDLIQNVTANTGIPEMEVRLYWNENGNNWKSITHPSIEILREAVKADAVAGQFTTAATPPKPEVKPEDKPVDEPPAPETNSVLDKLEEIDQKLDQVTGAGSLDIPTVINAIRELVPNITEQQVAGIEMILGLTSGETPSEEPVTDLEQEETEKEAEQLFVDESNPEKKTITETQWRIIKHLMRLAR